MNTTFFALGVHKICGWDFMEEHQLGPKLPFRKRWAERSRRLHRLIRRPRRSSTSSTGSTRFDIAIPSADATPDSVPSNPEKTQTNSRKPRQSSISAMMDSRQRILPTAPLEAPEEHPESPFRTTSKTIPMIQEPPDPEPKPPLARRILLLIAHIPPATYAIVLGLLFSLVQPLKALLKHSETYMPNAPDGNPPLSWLLDTAAFIGAMTVPMALILLGSSFARLKFQRGQVPVVAIVAMTAVKSEWRTGRGVASCSSL